MKLIDQAEDVLLGEHYFLLTLRRWHTRLLILSHDEWQSVQRLEEGEDPRLRRPWTGSAPFAQQIALMNVQTFITEARMRVHELVATLAHV